MKLPYFYLNLYEIGVSEYHLKIIWKNHRKSIKCSHTRSEWFHIFSTDEGIASISYNPAVYVYEIFIYSSYTFIYFATVWSIFCTTNHIHTLVVDSVYNTNATFSYKLMILLLLSLYNAGIISTVGSIRRTVYSTS